MDAKRQVAKDELNKLKASSHDGYIVFAELRRAWERQYDNNFDLWLLTEIYNDNAWVKDSYRGQARHGRGFQGEDDKQLVKLYIF